MFIVSLAHTCEFLDLVWLGRRKQPVLNVRHDVRCSATTLHNREARCVFAAFLYGENKGHTIYTELGHYIVSA